MPHATEWIVESYYCNPPVYRLPIMLFATQNGYTERAFINWPEKGDMFNLCSISLLMKARADASVEMPKLHNIKLLIAFIQSSHDEH